MTVPSGSRIRVDYGDPAVPTLSVRVQEVFGWAQAPQVAGRPLRLQLLSPAQRVVATTADLAVVLDHRLPGRPQRAPRALSPAPLARGPGRGTGHEASFTTVASLRLRARRPPARIAP